MRMSNELMTQNHEWVRLMNNNLDEAITKLEKLYDNPAPTLGGEVYLTDKEVSAALKVSRRTLQDYRNNGILPYRMFGGKIHYRESDIEKVLESGYKEAYRLSK